MPYRAIITLLLIVCVTNKADQTIARNERADLGQECKFKPDESPSKPISVLLLNGFFTGHLFPLISLGEELIRRGHNVTLCTTVVGGSSFHPGRIAEAAGINFINAGSDNMTKESMREFSKFKSWSKFVDGLYMAHETTLKLVTAMDNADMNDFDIIICDYSVHAAGVYEAVLGKRVIFLASFIPPEFTVEPNWPELPPASLGDQTLFDRLMVAIFYPLFKVMRWYCFDKAIMDMDERFRQVIKDNQIVHYLGIKAPMLLTTVIGVDTPNLLTPMKHYVGPVLKESLQPLSTEVESWLDSRQLRSVIYISMGTTGYISNDYVRILVEGTLQTKYDVIWALREENRFLLDLVTNSSRFLLQGWVPQQTLLQHQSLALTIHHCGFNTVQESLYNGLPVVCLPHGFDQFQIGTIVDRLEVGVSMYSLVDKMLGTTKFSAADLTASIQRATSDKFLHNVEQISKVYKFAGGSKAAADLVEFYEDIGYDHLIPAFARYKWSWVKYRNLDVYCLLLCVCGLLLYAVYKCCRHIVC